MITEMGVSRRNAAIRVVFLVALLISGVLIIPFSMEVHYHFHTLQLVLPPSTPVSPHRELRPNRSSRTISQLARPEDVNLEPTHSNITPLPSPRSLLFGVSQNLSDYSHLLTPLRDYDTEYYTIRINTYQRYQQLALSIQHHLSCPGLAQLQIIWCEKERPPSLIMDFVNTNDKVVLEYHSVNSLNERFKILHPTPTLGVLSMDDDILRPCSAIDAAFFQWTLNPDRMVGFDPRGHVLKAGQLFIRGDHLLGALGYSIALPRYCFFHRDYMHWYTTDLPRSMFEKVERRRNCEDLAMSMFVTRLTGGKAPLLADHWARWVFVELESDNAISDTKRHKMTRMICLNDFADALGLKESWSMSRHPLDWNESYMDYVDTIQHPRFQAVKRLWQSWHNLTVMKLRGKLKYISSSIKRKCAENLLAWNVTGLLQ